MSFGSQWFDLATASGIYQDETDTQEVVVIGDGAAWIWKASVSERLQTQAGYFQKHAHRMQYQKFVENGYHIGSGVIESACKHVVDERCKQAAMKWSTSGINAILFWRCLLKNGGAWDAFWRKHAKTA